MTAAASRTDVMHLLAEDLDLYARGKISESERAQIEGHLAACALCHSKYVAALEFSHALAQLHREVTDMRQSRRVPTDDPATLVILSPAPESQEVRIRDVSKSGMCIRSPKPIGRGSHVKVQRGTLVAFGEVRYCVAVGDMFHAGVLLREVSEI